MRKPYASRGKEALLVGPSMRESRCHALQDG
jgi:hypothetical protein